MTYEGRVLSTQRVDGWVVYYWLLLDSTGAIVMRSAPHADLSECRREAERMGYLEREGEQ